MKLNSNIIFLNLSKNKFQIIENVINFLNLRAYLSFYYLIFLLIT